MSEENVFDNIQGVTYHFSKEGLLEDWREEALRHREEIERLNKELETLKQPQVFIDTQDMEERYGEELYKEYLEKENKRLNNIIKELREMLEHKVEFHKNLDFYEDKELETQAYYNYVACLQDFDEIVEKYKLRK